MKDLIILFATFFKIGLFSFGGGYAMLALIEAEVVDKRRWITKTELADIFAIAESTPGPIAINTATFIGTKHFGVFGGIFATFGVVLPSFAIITALSVVLDAVKDNKWVEFLFRGIRIGVLVLIAKAVLSFFKSMKKTLFSFALMTISFILVFVFKVDVIYVILGTIAVCSVAVAVTTYVKNRKYHTVGTPEYYNERVGKPVAYDELTSNKAEALGIVKYAERKLPPAKKTASEKSKRKTAPKKGATACTQSDRTEDMHSVEENADAQSKTEIAPVANGKEDGV